MAEDSNGDAGSKGDSIIAQLNREKQELMAGAARITLQIFNDQADPFTGGGSIYQTHGTGFIVDIQQDEMIIFTNRHVIEIAKVYSDSTSSEGFVKMPDFVFRRLTVGKKFGSYRVMQKADAQVLFVSPVYDFAVLKVKIDDLGKGAREFFRAANLVNTSSLNEQTLRQGRQVMAYGYPQDAVEVGTQGTISATSQRVEGMRSVIMTDAPINGGNSGGPLIDMETGLVLGVNTWKLDGAESMGYAQPMVYIWEEYQRYLENPQYGSRNLPFITLRALDRVELSESGLMDDLDTLMPVFAKHLEKVFMVQQVEKGVNLAPGDLLIKVNDQVVDSSLESLKNLYNLSVGQSIKVMILRAGKLKTVKIPIREQVVKTEVFANYIAFSGLVVRDLTRAEKEIYGIKKGVMVGALYHDPIFQLNQELEGAVLTTVHGPNGVLSIDTIDDLHKYLLRSGRRVLHFQLYLPDSSLINAENERKIHDLLRTPVVIGIPFTGGGEFARVTSRSFPTGL